MIRTIVQLAGWMTMLAAPVAAQCIFENGIVTGAGTGGFSGPAKFGTDVCVLGRTALVGAPQTPGPSHTPQGYSRVYRFQREGWTQVQQLPPKDALTGTAVACDGEHLAIGAPGITSGGAALYERSGGQWVFKQNVGVPGVSFGRAVAIDGNWFAGQAPFDSGGSTVYLYQQQSDGSWTFQDSITGPGSFGLNGIYGQSLALGRGVLFIGSPTEEEVEVHVRQGTQWTLAQTLTSSDPESCGYGRELAFDGTTLIVSERCTDVVRFYRRFSGTWLETDSVALPTTGTSNSTGLQVDIDGHRAVVGVNEPFEQGRAYVLRERHTGWTLETELCMSAPTGNDGAFGNAVSIDGDAVVVGHVGYQTDGAAFFFDLSTPDFWEPGPTAIPVK